MAAPASSTAAAPAGAVSGTSAPSTTQAASASSALSAADERQRTKSIETIGWALFGLFLALSVSLFVLSGAADDGIGFTLAGVGWHMSHGQVLILGVLLAGALGGCIHVATSFSDYVGNATYKQSWRWWYMLRPFIGACLALAFYFLIRGGLLSLAAGTNPNQDPSFYGMVAISFLVGMFSKQATDKLADVFDTLFKTDKDNERRDGADAKVPVLNAITPPSVPVGSPDQQVVLTGANFTGAKVKVDGAVRAADSVADDRIAVTFKAAELAAAAKYKLSVENPAGAASATQEFEVLERRAAEGGTPDDRGGSGGGAQQPSTDAAGPTTIDLTNVNLGGSDPAAGSDASDPASAPAAETTTARAASDDPAPAP